MEVNRSPCSGICENRVLSVAQNSDGSLLCVKTCIDLALYQTALSKAEKIGVPRPGVCAICRDPNMDTYCQRCRDRVQDDIDRRMKPEPLPDRGFGPKTHSPVRTRFTDYAGYKMIFKQGRKSGSCHKCKHVITVGSATMAKNMSKVRGNYRYICIDCWDLIEKNRG